MIVLRAEILKGEIARRNLSQSEFARQMGTTASYLSAIILGKREPGPRLRERMQEFLNMTFDDLFEIREGVVTR